MTRINARIQTSSHPGSAHPWELSAEAVQQLAEQLPGKPVTANYDDERRVGTVVSATTDEVGVLAAIELDPDAALRFGPGFKVLEQEGTVVTKADLVDVGVWVAGA